MLIKNKILFRYGLFPFGTGKCGNASGYRVSLGNLMKNFGNHWSIFIFLFVLPFILIVYCFSFFLHARRDKSDKQED